MFAAVYYDPMKSERIAALVLLLILCGLSGYIGGRLAVPLGPPAPSALTAPLVVKAQRFQVVDERNRVLAELSGNALRIFDGQFKEHITERITLALGYNGKGYLSFSDGNWEGRAGFGFIGTDTPSNADDDWGLVIYHPKVRSEVVFVGTGSNGTRARLRAERGE